MNKVSLYQMLFGTAGSVAGNTGGGKATYVFTRCLPKDCEMSDRN